MKTIVAHLSVDLDAITACWLIEKYLPGWDDADLAFVPAGSTLGGKPPDADPDVIHVDTGFGKFDHHQAHQHTSAAKLVFDFICSKKLIKDKELKALEKIVNFANDTDHFGEVYFPQPDNDRYDFCLHQLIFGLRSIEGDDVNVVELVSKLLDASLQLMKNKVSAEEELKKGYEFKSKWGRSLVLETSNQESIRLGLKSGFSFVATKDPKKGSIRIKTLPEKKYDLTALYDKIIEKDKKGTWFFHVSKNMLLNASSKNPNFIPSPVTLQELIEIIKEV
jgi:hypothetical protein